MATLSLGHRLLEFQPNEFQAVKDEHDLDITNRSPTLGRDFLQRLTELWPGDRVE